MSVSGAGCLDVDHVEIPLHLVREQAVTPTYAQPGDAGADLASAIDLSLAPGERALVPTGVAIALPPGYVGLVHPRSGLAHRCGVTVLNAPGTIDSGYRGEIFVNLINLDPHEAVAISIGDRVAQLLIQRVSEATFTHVDALADAVRGDTGHGSTGGVRAFRAEPIS